MVRDEYEYFETTNIIRLISREAFTKINPEINPKKLYSLLEELIDTLFSNHKYPTRFISDEIRNSE